MNPFKNISIFRDQDIYTNCSLKPWSNDTIKPGRDDMGRTTQAPLWEPTETMAFPEKQKFDLAYKHMMQENDRLQHLVQCLIVQLGKVGDKFPLKEIDQQMALFDKKHKPLYDDGGIDGTPRNT